MATRSTLLALLVLAIGPSVTTAQAAPGPGADWLWGGGFHLGLPTGDFADVADEGYGLAAHFVALPHGRPIGVRGEVSALVYDSRTYGPTDPYTDVGTVRTDSWFGNMLLGPELRLRQGTVRPYVHALAGLGYFATSSEGAGSAAQFTTHRDDTAFAWAVGGGVELAVGASTSIDVGVRYLANSEVDHLTGAVIPTDGAPVAYPRRSEVHVVTFTVGLAFGR
jgi:opacity protein-like surface antigen